MALDEEIHKGKGESKSRSQRELPKLLFVCVENAGRSQMAEVLARQNGFIAASAGTLPASKVDPVVAEVMHEKGLDLAGAVPKLLTKAMIEKADLVVTMGCSVEKVCPRPILAKMQKKLIDWNLDDPKGKDLTEVRRIAGEIQSLVLALSKQLSV